MSLLGGFIHFFALYVKFYSNSPGNLVIHRKGKEEEDGKKCVFTSHILV